MNKSPGKQFEEDWRKSFPDHIFIYRLKDGRNDYKSESKIPQPKNICDFISYYKGTLWLFENKSFIGTSLPIQNIVNNDKDYRHKQMAREGEKRGVNAGYIINHRDTNETYYLAAKRVEWHIEHGKQKSIPLDYIKSYGKLITQYRNRSENWRYNVLDLIEP